MRWSADQAGRDGRQVTPPSRAAVAALQAALATEQAASYGYGVVGAHLTGTKFGDASADWISHQRARDELMQMIFARGAKPRPAAVAYKLPMAVRTGADAVALAIVLEHQVTAAYLGLVAQADPVLREFGARRMQAAAVRAARWGGRSQAFPGLPASTLRADHGSAPGSQVPASQVDGS
jgi:hypothetical protein